MAIDVYLQIEGIKGESADSTHQGWIELTSAQWGVLQPKSATASTGGGHTAERCEHGEMIFGKDMDVVSPLLYQHASGGSTFDEVTVEFYRADGEGKRVRYLEIKLKYVLIASVSPSVVSQGVPSETFALKYAAVQWKYTQQKIGGNQGGNSQGAWSLTKNDKTYSV